MADDDAGENLEQESVAESQPEVDDEGPWIEALDYEPQLKELCQAKAEEFHLLGYEEVSAQNVWGCVARKWKKMPGLHEAVADILSLQVGQLMNYLTISAFRGELDNPDD